MDVARIAMVSITSMAMAVFPAAGAANAEPPPTQAITTVAIGPSGQPINGYREAPAQGNVVAVNDCSTPSPSAVADNIYYCSPSAAGAGTCWPSTPGSLLCVDNPWDKTLHRVNYGGSLPSVQPVDTPEPFALALDDGTHCLLRNGGAWGGRDDGYVGAYWCGDPRANLPVLCASTQRTGSCIDRSAAAWTVKVGELGTPGAHFPPPETRTVTSAWFAGSVT